MKTIKFTLKLTPEELEMFTKRAEEKSKGNISALICYTVERYPFRENERVRCKASSRKKVDLFDDDLDQ